MPGVRIIVKLHGAIHEVRAEEEDLAFDREGWALRAKEIAVEALGLLPHTLDQHGFRKVTRDTIEARPLGAFDRTAPPESS